NHSEWDRGRDAGVFDSGERSEPFAEIAVKILPAFLIVAAETRVDFEKKSAVRLKARVGRGGLHRAANEKRSRGQERERKRDLDHDERIAREKFPAAFHRVFAGVLFQIGD